MMNNILLKLLQSGGNPQTILMNMLQNQAQNNPMMNNIFNMAQSGDSKGIETIARNLCKERGVDPDVALSQIRSQLHF